MTARDFKYWLRGWIELSAQNRFHASQIIIIEDHLKIVEDCDEFINWLAGAIAAAKSVGKSTSFDFFELVSKKLSEQFEKVTPDRTEIQKACDEVRPFKIDEDKLKKLLEDIQREVLPQIAPLVVSPLVVGPQIQEGTGGFVKTTPSDFTVYCSNEN